LRGREALGALARNSLGIAKKLDAIVKGELLPRRNVPQGNDRRAGVPAHVPFLHYAVGQARVVNKADKVADLLGVDIQVLVDLQDVLLLPCVGELRGVKDLARVRADDGARWYALFWRKVPEATMFGVAHVASGPLGGLLKPHVGAAVVVAVDALDARARVLLASMLIGQEAVDLKRKPPGVDVLFAQDERGTGLRDWQRAGLRGAGPLVQRNVHLAPGLSRGAHPAGLARAARR